MEKSGWLEPATAGREKTAGRGISIKLGEDEDDDEVDVAAKGAVLELAWR